MTKIDSVDGDSNEKHPPNSTATRILVVDDHPVVRQGLRSLLDRCSDLEICGEADGEETGIQEFNRLSPDFVVSDLSLNDGSGIELIKELLALRPSVKILVWSMHDEMLFAERVLRAGAKGYVNKGDDIEHVIEAIRRILDGKIYVSDRVTDRLLCRTIGTTDGEDISPIESLSDRELEVFEEIGRGATTRQIAKKLELSPKTVETYRENIKSKLNLANAAELTRHAVQWVLEDT